jgi:hypothetical protein
MADEKTFDKANLLKFFSDAGPNAIVGAFVVITPGKTLYDDEERTRYQVEARTEALWAEKYGLAFVVQSVEFPDGGRTRLPKDHFLRQDRTAQMRYGNGVSSAVLARWAMELADQWRGVVEFCIPTEEIDLRTERKEPGIDAQPA